MKTMRKLYDQTMEELDGVIEYSKCAMMYAGKDDALTKMYVNMAKTEMEHAKALHEASKRLSSSKIGTEDIDPRLMELWEEMESCKIDKMGHAQACLDLAQS